MRLLQARAGRALAVLALTAVGGVLVLAGRPVHAQAPTTITPTPAPAAAPAATPAAPTTNSGGATVTYSTGWNLVALTPDTDVSKISGPLYTMQPGDTDYETIQQPTNGGTAFGFGYWAYFSSSTQVTLGSGHTDFYAVLAPAGGYIMVGNPSGTEDALVTGADIVYTYDPVSGMYGTAPILMPGQGAWVYSNAGGPVTVTPSANVAPLPPPSAQPPSARFYGSVTVSGAAAGSGTPVAAHAADGASCGTTTVGAAPASGSNYSLDLTGSDSGCTAAGSPLTFTVNGTTATVSGQSAVPDVSGAVQANLSVP